MKRSQKNQLFAVLSVVLGVAALAGTGLVWVALLALVYEWWAR